MWTFLSILVGILLLSIGVRFVIGFTKLVMTSRIIYVLVMLILIVSLVLLIGQAASAQSFFPI